MSAFLTAFIVMAALGLVAALATGVPVVLRAKALQRRSTVLREHPTLVALLRAQTIGEKLRGLDGRIAHIAARCASIGAAAAELLETSAILRLEVDRVSFATRLLLQTIVPTLRGSMAD